MCRFYLIFEIEPFFCLLQFLNIWCFPRRCTYITTNFSRSSHQCNLSLPYSNNNLNIIAFQSFCCQSPDFNLLLSQLSITPTHTCAPFSTFCYTTLMLRHNQLDFYTLLIFPTTITLAVWPFSFKNQAIQPFGSNIVLLNLSQGL